MVLKVQPAGFFACWTLGQTSACYLSPLRAVDGLHANALHLGFQGSAICKYLQETWTGPDPAQFSHTAPAAFISDIERLISYLLFGML